jgi:hypothetical protein
MIDGKRVVAWTPYGREKTVSILRRHLQRDHDAGIVDEWWLCMNTDPSQVSDQAYGMRLAQRSGGWITALRRPEGLPRLTPKQRNTGYFFRYMIDPDTVFVRLDDDIVYVHPDAITSLVSSRIAMHDSVLGAFAEVWNNAVVSWFAQQHGIIPRAFGEVGSPYCMDPVGWADGTFAVKIHNMFLDLADQGPEALKDLYLYQDIPLAERQQFSVSCSAIDGRDIAALDPPGVLDYPEEEHWLTVHRPGVVGKSNVICGSSLVSHYTFYPQQRAVHPTTILDRYRAIAEKI